MAPLATAGDHSNAREKKADVATRPPSAGPPDLAGNDDTPGEPGVQVQPSAGGTRGLAVSTSVQDENGHNDIEEVTLTVYKADGTTVHVAPIPATKASATGKQAVYEALFQMQYHDPPGTYHVKFEATDRDGASSTSSSEFIFEELSAVAMGTDTLLLNPDGDEGTAIAPGDDTRGNPSIATFTNAGNVPIDAELSGTDLSNADGSAALAVERIVYAESDTFDPETTLTATPTRTALNLAPGASSSIPIYFAADIPDGTAADTYRGTMTLLAVKAT